MVKDRIHAEYGRQIDACLNKIYSTILIKDGKINYSLIGSYINKMEGYSSECIEYFYKNRQYLNKYEIKELLRIIDLFKFYKRNGVIETLKKYIGDGFLFNKKDIPSPVVKKSSASNFFDAISKIYEDGSNSRILFKASSSSDYEEIKPNNIKLKFE